MAASITHAKVVNTAQVPDPTQAELNAQIALGNYPAGTVLADIALGSDFNAAHTISGVVQSPASSVAGQVPMFGASSDLLETASFLAGFNVAAPNATVPVASFTAYDTGYTSIDVAIVPKGFGGFALSVSDGIDSNKRGARAIDLQCKRGAPTHVASGTFSIAAGSYNTASGSYTIAIGSANIASSVSAISIGYGNTAGGISAIAIGTGNNITDQYSYGIGTYNTISVRGCVALGYQNNSAGTYCYSLGYKCTSTAAGTYTFLAGLFVKSSANSAFVIGKGVSSGSPLNNTVATSLWLGVNSTVPSLAIWNAGGSGKYGKVSIGSNAAPSDSCLFEVVSTTMGMRPPKMTTVQKAAIATPSEGLLVHDTTQKVPNVYITAWEQIALDTKYRNQFLLMGA